MTVYQQTFFQLVVSIFFFFGTEEPLGIDGNLSKASLGCKIELCHTLKFPGQVRTHLLSTRTDSRPIKNRVSKWMGGGSYVAGQGP